MIEEQIIMKVLRLNWDSTFKANSENNQTKANVKNRHSEPEEHKDVGDLIGGPSKGQAKAQEPQLNTRHSHTHNIKTKVEEKDPFADIDFSKF